MAASSGERFRSHDIGAFDPQFGGLDQEDAQFGGPGEGAFVVEHLVVEGHGQHVKAQAAGMIQQLQGGVIDLVERVFGGMEVQVGFHPGYRRCLHGIFQHRVSVHHVGG